MKTKERHVLHWTWVALDDLCRELGRPATAGELAKVMGISRNTARKRLEEMVKNEAIDTEEVSRGHVTITRYGV